MSASEGHDGFDNLAKIVLLGESSSGKSCILERLCENAYSENHTTLVFDLAVCFLRLPQARLKCQIWDTSGAPRFRYLVGYFCRGSHALVVVFDVASEESYHAVPEWIRCYREHVPEATNPILVLGAKTDQERRVVRTEDARLLCSSLGAEYMECSARTAENIEEAFRHLGERILAARSCAEAPTPPTPPTSEGGASAQATVSGKRAPAAAGARAPPQMACGDCGLACGIL